MLNLSQSLVYVVSLCPFSSRINLFQALENLMSGDKTGVLFRCDDPDMK
jgi:hypothetical protein